jgi:hypothetical protein
MPWMHKYRQTMNDSNYDGSSTLCSFAVWDLTKFQAAWFLLDWVNKYIYVYIYLWAFWYADCWCHVKCKLRWVWTAWTFGIAMSDLAVDCLNICYCYVRSCCGLLEHLLLLCQILLWTAWTFVIAVSDLAVDCLNIWYCCVRSCCGLLEHLVLLCHILLRTKCMCAFLLCVGIVWGSDILLCMDWPLSKFWFWTGSGPNLWYVKQKWKWNQSEYEIGCH